MSWDLEYHVVQDTIVWDRNFTYNNSEILSEAFGRPFRELHGKLGRELAPLIAAAVLDITDKRALYELLEPPNGWGGINDVLDVLNHLAQWCQEKPEGWLMIF
jgi:hypothetical protein